MTAEESLALARKRIEFLERCLSEEQLKYDRMAVDAYDFRRRAQQLDFAVRDHRHTVLGNRSSYAVVWAAHERLWNILNSR
jgi:hypothetical protein